MRSRAGLYQLLFISLAMSLSSFAADPPYTTDKVDGFYMAGFDAEYKVHLTPGTFSACTENSQPSYTFWSCDASGTETEVEVGTKTHKFVFDKVSVYETAASGSYPATLSYMFSGKYGRTLPDGTTYTTDASMSFSRKLSDPTRAEGRLTVYNLGIDGGIILVWPGTAKP